MRVKTLLLAGLAAVYFNPASATIISVIPTGGSTGVLVVNNACADEFDGPALTITGCLNNLHTAAGDVDFTSTEPILFGSGGGQAVVQPADGLTQTLTINPRSSILARSFSI